MGLSSEVGWVAKRHTLLEGSAVGAAALGKVPCAFAFEKLEVEPFDIADCEKAVASLLHVEALTSNDAPTFKSGKEKFTSSSNKISFSAASRNAVHGLSSVHSTRAAVAAAADVGILGSSPGKSSECWPAMLLLSTAFEEQQGVGFGGAEDGENAEAGIPDQHMADLMATMAVKAVLGMEHSSAAESVSAAEAMAEAMSAFPCPDSWGQQEVRQQQQHQQREAAVLSCHHDSWASTACPAYLDCHAWAGSAGSTMWQSSSSSSAAGAVSFLGSAEGFDFSGGEELRTTVMLRNIPPELSRDMLIELLDSLAFSGRYDLVYIPVDFSTGVGLGYAFVNMVSPHDVVQLWTALDGFSRWAMESDKVCSISWSEPNQGLSAHVERYRNSPVMHPDVPKEWKPALFLHGVQVQFPPPTKKLKAPKVRSKKSVQNSSAVAGA